ncbi:protein-L-isoaspartate O-methyltransferase family protein [Tepidimonas aquatica]|uniref:Protein-L-isoaspartate O-methyltransferase n=1 Tax=Tepidimonas aquatica TaxID=247482 RepID=A0A554WEQ7_9BURK|nr:protein-L-isoaspartate O-methyltransferase [Tepidimonas aquatica]TSE22055.1 Protein-L-isoaspartate O-methyltransferase [Tepidimonas aquatica]
MSATAFDFEKARFNMIEQQIRPWEVLDARVLALLGQLKREDFVPEAYRALALADLEIPLSQPAVEGECMLAPKVEARTLQELDLQPQHNVLEIGAGSGYMAALMGRLAQQVLTLEINPRLADMARHNLARAGLDNVRVKTADAAAHRFAACVDAAPYDVIVLSGGVAEVPTDLLELLRVGGRLFAFVGDEVVMRATIVTRASEAGYHSIQPWDIVVPRLRNFPEPTRFQF